MKKIFKVILAVLTVVLVLAVAAVVYIFNQLPSAEQIGTLIKKDSKIAALERAKTSSDEVSKTQQDNTSIADSNEPSKEDSSNLPSSRKKDLDEYLDFIDPSKPRAKFCSFLNRANGKKLDFSKFNKNQDQQTDTSEIENDLRFKAIEPVFKSIVMQPKFNDLIMTVFQNEILEKAAEDKYALENIESVKKAQFYKKIYDAYDELRQNLTSYEDLMDRSYLVYKMNDLLVLKPELKEDPRLMNYCEKIQEDFNLNQQVQFEHEKNAFERLIAELGVSESEIQYNKNYKTKFGVKFTNNSLIMDGGWLDEVVTKPNSPQPMKNN